MAARRERFVAGISASHAEILTVKEATLARDLTAWLDEEAMTHLACGQAAAGRRSRPPAPGDLC
jgi:L-lactate dehydrogenase complex protein LldG